MRIIAIGDTITEVFVDDIDFGGEENWRLLLHEETANDGDSFFRWAHYDNYGKKEFNTRDEAFKYLARCISLVEVLG